MYCHISTVSKPVVYLNDDESAYGLIYARQMSVSSKIMGIYRQYTDRETRLVIDTNALSS